MRNETFPVLVADSDRPTSIIRPGQNAWRMATADRLNVLVDELLVQAREERLGARDSSMGTFDGELVLPG